ncbi:bone morphogenetic protein 10 [Corythoichthys intestinalis]|uniref:bone morphogenetic protein 10 n=1 Tax=Corythoichthys intestinalis TaxID=161448 RepID=UPI0025A64B0C|nr:bone morphogenetic protein 10 [Corythoichthys intestinalis]
MARIWVSLPGTICSIEILHLLFFILLLQGPLCGQSSPISNTGQRLPPIPGLGDGLGRAVEQSNLEQDNNVIMEGVLESLKEQYLQTFNLSGMGLPPLPPGILREEPPEYMMELYNRFANDRNSVPSASIVRSFKNEDSSSSTVGVGGVRHHPLLFNVSVPHHERIISAELRLYTLVQTDRHLFAGVDRKVTIYEVLRQNGGENSTDENLETGDNFGVRKEHTELVELASRQVYGTDNGWEAFNLTAAAQRWRKSVHGSTHRLEVHIDSVEGDAQHATNRNKNRINEGDMKIDTNMKEKHKPLLIVFSDDESSDHRDDKQDLNEMIDHETSDMILSNYLEKDMSDESDSNGQSEPDEEDLIQMRSNLIYDTSSRIRRNAKGDHCGRRPLRVDFKDIGWDSWILAPSSYDAYECAGICSFPLTKHVTPTKHAIVQTLVNINSPHTTARACCVPTKLEPISLLYLDDTGVVTFKHKYEGMVVAECGCR